MNDIVEIIADIPPLAFKDIIIRGQPQELRIGMLFNQLERDKAFPCAGRVNDRSATIGLQHFTSLLICYLVMPI